MPKPISESVSESLAGIVGVILYDCPLGIGV